MKKSVIWIAGGIILIALIVGGYFYFKASADVISAPNTGSTDVALNYIYRNTSAQISITNNTTKPIGDMKVYIPSTSPTSVTAKYGSTYSGFLISPKQTAMPIIGFNGYSVDTSGASLAINTLPSSDPNSTPYTIASKYIVTSGIYKVFPVVGANVISTQTIPAIPAKSTYFLTVSFKSNFTSSPVTVTASHTLPNSSDLSLNIQIAKTQAVTEKTIRLYIPNKIGVDLDPYGSRPIQYAFLGYNNQQDLAVPVNNKEDLQGYYYNTSSVPTITAKTGDVKVSSSAITNIGNYVVFSVYPMLTVPALANGEKYIIHVNYAKGPTPVAWTTQTSVPVTGGLAFGYTVKTRDNWKKYIENDTSHGITFYTDNLKCDVSLDQTTLKYKDESCFDDLAIAVSGALGPNSIDKLTQHSMVIKTYPASNGLTAYVGVSASTSAEDQKIIFDSFKITP